MSFQVLRVGGGKGRHPVAFPSPLPLSPRSFLAWAGFTDEGTPLTMDSAGIVRMMHYRYGYTWTVVLDSKLHVSLPLFFCLFVLLLLLCLHLLHCIILIYSMTLSLSLSRTPYQTRGKSDHYFLIGASERQSNVRCILCKGSRFPPVIPKPHVSILSMKVNS